MSEPASAVAAAQLSAWARLLLGSLAEAGVRDVVISPGSRSTPLVLAATRTEGLNLVNLLDERSAAFYALGQARVTGRPSLLICTSGTAGAHYLPAVIEASQAGLPMLLLTADRPFALQGCDAPQTIDQRDLFGRFARAAIDLGLPDPTPLGRRALRRIASQALHQTLWPLPGPVHLNFRASKPLEPEPGPALDAALAEVEALLRTPRPRAHAPDPRPGSAGLAALAEALRESRRPLIVAGPDALSDEASRSALLSWSRRVPVLAEATSQLRFGPGAGALRVGAFDLLLRDPAFGQEAQPDLVVQLGAPPTSGLWERWLGEQPALRRFVIRPHGWSDPQSNAEIVLGSGAEALASLQPTVDPRWSALWAEAEARAWRAVDAVLAEDPRGELSLARAALDGLPAGALLMLGNSLPIRDVDLAAPPRETPLGVLHQRGANGIDGLVSGAAGAAAASGRPLLLLLGDVSLIHDLGGLLAASRARTPLAVVVLDNGGGRIFTQLPVARTPDLSADELAQFTTPHGASLAAAAAVFGIPFVEADHAALLTAKVCEAMAHPGPTLIRARTAPESHGAQLAAITARLRRG